MLKTAVLLAVIVGVFCKDASSYGLIAPSFGQFSRDLIIAGGYDGYIEHNEVDEYPLLQDDGVKSWVESSKELPKMYDRRSFAASNVFEDYFFTFGGNSTRLELQQLWSPLASEPTGPVRDEERAPKEHIYYDGNGPHPRIGHSATIRNRELYIYGGYDLVHKKFSNHFWMANLAEGYIRWELLDVEGAPGARGGHSSILYQESLYIFGGQNEAGFFNDVWRFDFITGKWVRAWVWDEVSEHPFGRVGHVGILWDDETYVVFGGYGTDDNGNTRFLNDMWAFDLQKGEWRRIDDGAKAGFADYNTPSDAVPDPTTPSPRAFPAHALIDGQLIIIGGQVSAASSVRQVWSPYTRWREIDYPEDFAADAWAYDFYKSEWKFIKCLDAFGHGEERDPRLCKSNNLPTCAPGCSEHGFCVAQDVCQCRGAWQHPVDGDTKDCPINTCADGFLKYDLDLLDRILISESILNLGQKLAALKTKLKYVQEYIPEFEDYVTIARSNPDIVDFFNPANTQASSAINFNHDISALLPILEEFNDVLEGNEWSNTDANILANAASSFYYPSIVAPPSDDDVATEGSDLDAFPFQKPIPIPHSDFPYGQN